MDVGLRLAVKREMFQKGRLVSNNSLVSHDMSPSKGVLLSEDFHSLLVGA